MFRTFNTDSSGRRAALDSYARGSQAGGVLGGTLVVVLVIVVAFAAIGYTFGTVVPPGKMGVRQIAFGPYQGFSKQALSSGYHWSIPFYSRIHIFPRTIQVLNLSRTTAKT